MDLDSAGWWPTGDGRERFWDGTCWTDQVRPLGGQRAQSARVIVTGEGAATAASPASQARKRGPRRLLVTLLAFATVGTGCYFAGQMNLPALLAMPSNGTIPARPAAQPAVHLAAKAKAKVKAKPSPAHAVTPVRAPAPAIRPISAPPHHAKPTAAPAPMPVVTVAPTPKPVPHSSTAADCAGDVLATAHVLETPTTATLVGTITNETGFPVNMGMMPIIAQAWDLNGQEVELAATYTMPADQYLQPGQTIAFRSPPLTMQRPDLRWELTNDWNPVSQFTDYDTIMLCNERAVPSITIWE